MWTADSTSSPHETSRPSPVCPRRRGLDYISSQAWERGQPLQTTAYQDCEKSTEPLALFCTCWGTWPGPPSLWARDPTFSSLLTRTCCPRSWRSVLHLELLTAPPTPSLVLKTWLGVVGLPLCLNNLGQGLGLSGARQNKMEYRPTERRKRGPALGPAG